MANRFLPPGHVEIVEQLTCFQREYSAQMESLSRLADTMGAPTVAVSQFAEQLTKAGEDARASLARLNEVFGSTAWLCAEQAKSYASAYQSVVASLARALEVPQLFEGFKLPTFEFVEVRDQRVLKAACKLADAGWAFFWDAAPVDVVKLANADLSPADLDDEIVRYYEHEETAELKVLTKRLVQNARLAKWRGWLDEALWAYEQQRYRVVIPSLLSIIEGLVYDTAGTLTDRATRPAAQWQMKATAGGTDRGFYVEVGWSVVARVLAAVWKKHYFDESASPDRLNRHWVLHGRSPEVGGKADALRLLVALDCIAVTIQHTEERLKLRTDLDEDSAA